ncbi:hypothetical protein NI17_014445 [Thermobifida halotolerans]|uniref:Uncharacterized protein n=1 Tax=Thermobifida halotolerans TaxID=483545 RepID=A0AA97LU15_9ACTN|nr:hypothetical protein [Thermobifida halotolerans]UOE18050.1 hypothetical protein NI17_014445 [Thermobifida halotolerans]
MNGNRGADPLHGLDDVDWGALAPERGKEIPGLLRGVRGVEQEASLVALHEILAYPGPGYAAAPRAVEFLLNLVEQGVPGRHQVLNLVQELAVPAMADHLPDRRDLALWRDEVAWVSGADAGTARDQYAGWLAEAPDEQERRRITGRLRALGHDNGTAVVAAELAAYEAVRDRLDVLLGVLEGRANRGGESVAEWAAYILAWYPEEAERIVPALLNAGDPRQADPDLRPLPAEVWALGMLADPADATVTVHLGQLLNDADDDLVFAAALALGLVHGPAVPEQAVARLLDVEYWEDHFATCLPQSGAVEPAHLGMLAVGAVDDEELRAARTERLRRVLAYTGPDGWGIVVADALESVFGPRPTGERPAGPVDFGGCDQEQRNVLTAVAEVDGGGWDGSGLAEVLTAWGLPGKRAALRSLVGLPDEAPRATPSPQLPEAGGAGLLGRLFGGNR